MSRVGDQNPTYRYSAEYEKSEGEYAIELARAYALPPHPWQELVLEDWLAVDANGKLINSLCTLEVPRQNGKTGVADPRVTWGLVGRAERILYTAQEFQTAKIAFDRTRKKFGVSRNDMYAEFPELNALVDHYTVSAGQMVLDLINGAHIEFRTRGNNSDMGRGGTFDVVIIDEAQAYTDDQDASLSPLISAAPSGSPQIILMGTPPKLGDKGIVFTRAIERMHENPLPGDCIHEWSTSEIGDVTNKDRWYKSNPSLGYQLLEEAIAKDVVKMSPDVFAREHLGFLVKRVVLENYAIDRKAWEACKSSEPKPDGKTAYGVKFSADGSTVCLAGCVLDAQGIARISLIDIQTTARGTRWLADWLNDRYTKACCVVIDGRNGVEVLVDRLVDVWKMKNSIRRPNTNEVIASVGMLIDSINEGTLTWYEKQELLDDSAITSTKRPIGKSGGYGFGGDNCIPIEACALALWGVKTSKRDPNRQMRIG